MSQELLNLLGSFWSDTFAGPELRTYLSGVAALWRQAHARLEEAVDADALHTAPVVHREDWWQLTLRRSEMNVVNRLRRYGDGATYGLDYRYGETVSRRLYTFPCPQVTSAAAACDQFRSPAVCWAHGADFWIDADAQQIIFAADPFAAAFRRELLPDGDAEAFVWLFAAEFERDYLYRHFGQLLGVQQPSSEAYRRYLTALWRSVVGGTARAELELLLSAVLDAPLAERAGEIVADIAAEQAGTLIITDSQVYRAPATAQVVVQIGQTLQAGQPLTDALEFLPLNRGHVPDMPALGVGLALLAPGFVGDLVLPNADVPTTVTTDDDGRTVLQFPVWGFPADVELFWDVTHTRGVQQGRTLAELLDLRAEPEGQPTVADLPATINPTALLLQHGWRFHGLFVRLRLGSAGPLAVGLRWAQTLRRIMPPRTLLLLLLEMPTQESNAYGAEVAESAETQVYLELVDEAVPLPQEDDAGASPRLIGGACA